MKAFVALILCIASSVPPVNKAVFAKIAREHGYQVSHLNNKETAYASYAWAPNRCALTVMPSTADHVGIYFLYYDKSQLVDETRADRLLRKWESWL